MAGDEEARARAVLAEMQFRIAEGPTSALGIGEVVTPEEVRTAFLALTKQYHPARFGRLSSEIQKLSNEVFLGIKSAHDHMLKALGSSTIASRGGSRAGSAIPLPQHGADGTSRTSLPRGTQSIPRIEGTSPPSARDGRASQPVIAGGSRSTPAMGVPIQSQSRAPTGSMPSLARSGDGRSPTGSVPVISREGGSSSAPSSTTGSVPQHRPSGSIPVQRPTGSIPVQRPTGSIPVQRPGTPPASTQPLPRAITPVSPGTVPGVGAQPLGRPGTPPPTTSSPTPGGGTQPLSRPGTPPPGSTQPITPVPPGTQPGVGTSAGASQRMVQVKTSTGAVLNVPASQLPRSDRASTPPLTRTMTPAARPDGSMNPPTQPPRPTPGIAPPTQPPRPTPGIAPPTQPPRPTPGIAPPTQPPRADSFNPPTVRIQGLAGMPVNHGAFDEAAAFRDAAALMEQKDWSAARLALHALAAKVPQSKTYRAWLCYARGREAYVAGRPDDAILEMQRALQLEPDLAHAKHALAELQRRR